eukprot:TRINITY_DN26598_c0_g1_i1.p1 TRINITY_DN26598_c0_g1~~TRINITY_DN26598_c0_g1_i1.p1  ORF type:complete len:210 (+),score=33.79 TRINITY_DN26598_c0_g1_i1:135-764(+)
MAAAPVGRRVSGAGAAKRPSQGKLQRAAPGSLPELQAENERLRRELAEALLALQTADSDRAQLREALAQTAQQRDEAVAQSEAQRAALALLRNGASPAELAAALAEAGGDACVAGEVGALAAESRELERQLRSGAPPLCACCLEPRSRARLAQLPCGHWLCRGGDGEESCCAPMVKQSLQRRERFRCPDECCRREIPAELAAGLAGGRR